MEFLIHSFMLRYISSVRLEICKWSNNYLIVGDKIDFTNIVSINSNIILDIEFQPNSSYKTNI